MKAIVTKQFPGRPDNEVMTRPIEVGEVITGSLAEVAVSEGWAEEEGAGSRKSSPKKAKAAKSDNDKDGEDDPASDPQDPAAGNDGETQTDSAGNGSGEDTTDK